MKPKDKYRYLRQNPTSELFKVLGIMLVASVVAIFLLNIVSDAVLSTVSVDMEMKIFGKSGADRIRTSRAFSSLGKYKEIEALDKILHSLADHQVKEEYNFRIFLVCTDMPNAFAIPGGDIMVTSGLVDKIQSENGLAMVVGHEMGHFYHRHHLKGLGKKLVFASLLLGVGMGQSGSDFMELFDLSNEYISLAFSRMQETDADEYGLDLMRDAYGTTNGASEFFASMAEERGDYTDFLSSHPQSEKRVANIQEAFNPNSNVEVRALDATIAQACK